MKELISIFPGNSEMARRMRDFDWAKTPLGLAEEWPESLKTCVHIMLTSTQPMFIWWGGDLICLYNDGYSDFLHKRHPWALGQRAQKIWPEVWHQIGPKVEKTIYGDEGTYDKAFDFIFERKGYPEEAYVTFSYSPIPDGKGGVGGLFCPVTDETERIVGEREMALLRELSMQAANAKTWQEACLLSVVALKTNRHDFPFALVYLIETDKGQASLIATSSIQHGHEAAPEIISLDSDSPWPVNKVMRTHHLCFIANLEALSEHLPCGACQSPPIQAVVLPLTPFGKTGKAYILVLGLNPLRQFDQNYQRFIELVSTQISAAIANGQSYEEEKKRAEALAELDRAKTTFFSNVSHEFRTPLTLILNPLHDALTDTDTNSSVHKERLQLIQRNAVRLLKLVNTLLDFSRAAAERIQAVYEPTELSLLTADLASNFRSAVEKAGLAFIVDIPDLKEMVYVDKEMWEKIIFNLLSNAFKYTLQGKITLSLHKHDNQVELRVQDTGVGIPEAELPHIFERFHRAETTKSRSYEGTGIGLALTQELVKLHGGTVQVESQVGVGSTFMVTIPLGIAHLPTEKIGVKRTFYQPGLIGAAYVEEVLSWLPTETQSTPISLPVEPLPSPTSLALGQTSTALLTKGRILFADDNADMRCYVQGILTPYWDVEAVTNGKEALEAIERQLPDLILTDVMMPEMDGYQLLKAVRANPKTSLLPVIMLSAGAGEEAKLEGLQASANDYLVKPFCAKELIMRINTHLELGRLRLQLEKQVQKEVQLRLTEERCQKDLENFINTICHEIRNPLTGIIGSTELLQVVIEKIRNFFPKTPAQSFIEEVKTALLKPLHEIEELINTINTCSQQQKIIVNDVLDYSKLENQKIKLTLKPFNPKELLQSAINMFMPQVKLKQLRVDLVLPEEDVRVKGDPARLTQILINIISNAVKFTEQGTIKITLKVCSLSEKDTMLDIIISDTGIGMTLEEKERLFQPFSQANEKVSAVYGGSGLGLVISQKLIELMKGTIEVQSQKDVGTEFHFTVCCGKIQPESKEQRKLSGKKQKKKNAFSQLVTPKNILVVEDNKINQRILVTYLNQAGYHPAIANDGKEAVQLYKQQQFDMVFMDIEMPIMGGLEATQKIRVYEQKTHRDPTIIIGLSGNASSTHIQEALAAGMNDYLTKPYHRKDIYKKIKCCNKMEAAPQLSGCHPLPTLKPIEEVSEELPLPKTEVSSIQSPFWNKSLQNTSSLPALDANVSNIKDCLENKAAFTHFNANNE